VNRKKTWRVFPLAFLLSGILGFSFFGGRTIANAQQMPEEREVFIREYAIGPKDLLEIKVFELPELNQTVRVSEDGTITLPLLGSVQIGGLTKDDVERKLAALLEAKYLKNAQISVFIKEFLSKRVALLGAVEKTGMYEVVGKLSLLQLISEAGGLKDNAGREIYVLREGKNGITASITIDLDDLFSNRNPNLNIPLQPNDVVNVPVDRIITIYVFGEVKNPGALQVQISKKISLLQAVAQAGGPTENASISKIAIKRRDKRGKEINMTVNLKDVRKGKKPDIILQEGDTIYVPESIF
jgi:polysaccharide export outer membrane protein